MSSSHTRISKADAAAYSSSDGDDSDDNGDGLTRQSVDPRDDDFLDFNPRKRRRTGRSTKEAAALGIFASDSDGDDAPNRRWKSKQHLRHKNVAFVSASREGLGRREDQYEEGEMRMEEGQEEQADDMDVDVDDDDDGDDDGDYTSANRAGLGAKPGASIRGNRDRIRGQAAAEVGDEGEDDDDEDEEMAGAGLGFHLPARGLGLGRSEDSRPPTTATVFGSTPSQQPNTISMKYDSSTPLGTSFVPTSATEPVLDPSIAEDGPNPAPQTPKPSAFGVGRSKASSFAARMMAKMGYVEGQGLGANAQGRASIIEATVRPQGNVGLGTVREKSQQELKEEKRQARLRGEDVPDSDEERTTTKRERRRRKAGESGSGSAVSTPKPPKPKYMTVDDIRRAAPGLHIPEAFAPILDMTGRDQKLLTSSSGLLTPTVGIELVEQTEARKLARRAQSDLAAFVEEWKTLEERKAWLGMETHQRQQEIDEPEREFASLQMFSVVLDDVCQAVRDRQWDPVISCLKKVATSLSAYNEELSSIAVASIHPFLAQAVQGWQPLEDPNLGNFTTDIREIKALLSPAGNVGSGATVAKCDHTDDDAPRRLHARSTTPYETMIYKIVFPKLATSVSQAWDAHDATPLLAVLERWEQLLPEFVRSQLLEQVVRKLESTMASWKPKKEQSTPPHLWLFPWLQHLPSHHLEPRGTGLVSEVRRKFRQTIDTWPFEKGVIPGLKQWRDVFRPSKTQDQWKPLVMHHILPSMGRYLRTHFRVDPGDQEPYLKILQGIVKWVDVISSSMVAEVIVTEVFPMWHDVLHQWLTSEDANYGEIGAWFEWWHGEVFPAEISSQDGIKTEFQRGAAMIETALELGDEVNHRLARPEKHPIRDIEPEAVEERQPKPPVLMPPSEVKQPTFRAEVEIWCEENDLRFIPVHKTNDLGKHYFRLTARLDGKGGVLVYFRGDDDALVAESRKINGVFRRNNKIEWDALLVALFEEVEGIKKK